jgi:hypothetical protein
MGAASVGVGSGVVGTVGSTVGVAGKEVGMLTEVGGGSGVGKGEGGTIVCDGATAAGGVARSPICPRALKPTYARPIKARLMKKMAKKLGRTYIRVRG